MRIPLPIGVDGACSGLTFTNWPTSGATLAALHASVPNPWYVPSKGSLHPDRSTAPESDLGSSGVGGAPELCYPDREQMLPLNIALPEYREPLIWRRVEEGGCSTVEDTSVKPSWPAR
jgi:hypothetical protein